MENPVLNDINKIYSNNNISHKKVALGGIHVLFLNAERGTHLNEIEVYFKYHPQLKDAEIILLNEIDIGMARSGNRNNAKELGEKLGMNWVFGTEFKELTKGGINERNSKLENKESLHGNAILSYFPFKSMEILRLPVKYDWLYDFQKREGGRFALLVTIELNGKDTLLVTVHLENKTDEKGRCEQLKALVDLINYKFNDLPVIVAGDMNTFGYEDGDDDLISSLILKDGDKGRYRREHPENYESLFAMMENNRFDYRKCNQFRKVSCRDKIKGLPFPLELNLDWFFTRDVITSYPLTVSTIFERTQLSGFKGLEKSDGIEMSDHNILSIKVE